MFSSNLRMDQFDPPDTYLINKISFWHDVTDPY